MEPSAKLSWRELNIEQMATWDDTPRRVVLVLLGLLVFIMVSMYMLIPAHAQLQAERAQTSALQQDYIRMAESVAHASARYGTASSQDIQIVEQSQLPIWQAQLAKEAQERHLHTVKIHPMAVGLSKKNTPTSQQSKDFGQGQLDILVEGAYADILNWWASLATRPQILSMEQIELKSIDNARVRAQLNLVFAQELQP